MDNLPGDPPNQNGGNNNNSTPASPASTRGEPAGGPDSSKHATYSEVAQHKIRDAHGRFLHSEHLANPNSFTPRSLGTECAGKWGRGFCPIKLE